LRIENIRAGLKAAPAQSGGGCFFAGGIGGSVTLPHVAGFRGLMHQTRLLPGALPPARCDKKTVAVRR